MLLLLPDCSGFQKSMKGKHYHEFSLENMAISRHTGTLCFTVSLKDLHSQDSLWESK